MHLLNTYALYCGAKINKSFIYESYFPLPFQKYITFQAETPHDGRNYQYWQDVIDMIVPILSKMNIAVIQSGIPKEFPYQRTINLLGQTNVHQLAYLIKNSMLHFGPDSFGVHLSSHYNIPVVALYSISMPEVAGPYFGDKNRQILFKAYERVGNKKPSNSPQESPKSINTIRPEEIANAIFKLLDINVTIPFETVFTGTRYSAKTIRELVPDSQHMIPFPEQPIELRYDLSHDVNLLTYHLNYLQKAIIVTDIPIDVNILKHFKSRIGMVMYEVVKDDSPEFAKTIVSTGVNLYLFSKLPPEEVQKKKISYYEYGNINSLLLPNPDIVNKLKLDSELYYRSCRFMFSKGKTFGSRAGMEKDLSLTNDFEYHRVIDSPTFWQDLEFYTIIKKI